MFDWHGGEPLLMGVDFYETIINAQQQLINSHSIEFKNAIQTNGILLTEKYLKFFAENNFGVGISFDGLPETTQELRFSNSPQNSRKFIQTISRQFKDFNLPFCVLCVVTKQNVHKGKEIFSFLSSSGVNSYSLLPLIKFPQPGCPDAPTNEELFEILKTTFELWLTPLNAIGVIDPINTIVRSLLTWERPALCSFSAACPRRMVTITPEGNIVLCGSLIEEQFILGNIFEEPLFKILSSRKTKTLQKLRETVIKEYCRNCEFIPICRGGCREAAFWHTGNYIGKYPYCEARKNIFQYIQKRLSELIPN